ncbi:MAG: hypothetical protein M3R65_11295 [Gemmatimonadota bacterium]|nr:hypothetical protein [Gemmatimonadota bacterium]
MTPPLRGQERRGVALLFVVIFVGVAAATVLAATDASLSERETTRLNAMRRRTLVASESEAWTSLITADVRSIRAAPVGSVVLGRRNAGDVALITTIDKVDTSYAWIVATATIRSGGSIARHRIGITVLIPRDSLDAVLHPVPQRAWAELF